MLSAIAIVVLLLCGSTAAQPGVLWQQHLDTAIYQDVGISRLGYVIAGTWLNEPEVAEIFDLEKGNKTIKSIGDSNPQDNAVFDVAIGALSSVAVASRTVPGNWTAMLYKWDAASPNPNPDWTLALDRSEVIGLDVCADGSLIAAAVYANLSFFQPPAFQVLFFDGRSGKEVLEYRFVGQPGQQGGPLATSDDGAYVAMLTATGTEFALVVLHLPSGQNHSQPTDFVIGHAYGQAFAMSGDGLYVAAGQADTLAVWKRDDSKPTLTYAPLFTFSTPTNTFFIETNAISFAAGAEILAAGWINVQQPAGQNRVTAFRLPSATPILDHTGPVGQGQYQNIVTGVRVSESGKYVAVTSWGNAGQEQGTQQVQVFAVTNSSGPVYSLFTAGSMFAVALTETSAHGTVVVAGGKHVHANVFGNGGDMYVAQVAPSEAATPAPTVDYKLIAQINAAGAGWRAGVNSRFLGVALDESKALMGTHVRQRHASKQTRVNASAIPPSFDARTQWPGCVGAIRDQQSCGSCWAFGAVEAFSDRVCIAGGKRQYVALSPEYVVDCDHNDFGCSGGYLAYVWAFLTTAGTVPDACVPYTAGTGQVKPCPSQCTAANATFRRYTAKAGTVAELTAEAEIQQAILDHGPVEAAFVVFSDFMNYKTGVYTHTSGIYMGGHAIKLLGWGVADDKTPYWIAANSWGTSWGGMNGYFLIKRGTDECYIESNAIAGLPNTAAHTEYTKARVHVAGGKRGGLRAGGRKSGGGGVSF